MSKGKSNLTGRLFGVYKDEACRQSLYDEGLREILVEFGKAIFGGEEIEATVWIRNESPDEFVIENVETGDDSLKIEIMARTLYPDKAVKMQVTWSPRKNRKNPLMDDIQIHGNYVVRPQY